MVLNIRSVTIMMTPGFKGLTVTVMFRVNRYRGFMTQYIADERYANATQS